ncbi:MAG: putative gamma-glutamyltransferase YwrD [Candidatus Heimdallarchaeota archaeon LC_2]|nr:MAG: putative gamma-glutamyltransferase YwrD [Candidatus Heimdallarchaeota archaeon LC_2]
MASSQPLAAEAGLRILQKGGNAADAAVATAAALNVTEPTSTGLGGDMFALYFDNKPKKVFGINGSGRSPKDLTLNKVNQDGYLDDLPIFHAHTITVPGAAAGWIDTIEKYGTLSMSDVLRPAIELARDGFPVSDITARAWEAGAKKQLSLGPNSNEMLLNHHAPKVGEMMKIPTLAKTFEEISEHGKSGYYEGRVAKSIIEMVQSKGGVMNLDDLKSHKTTFEDPISVNYKGIEVYEIPPSGQGITALIALNIIEEIELHENPLSVEYLHTLIEVMRIAFADAREYVADPQKVEVPILGLLDKKYAKERRKLFDKNRASLDVVKGSPMSASGTVYLSVVDQDGNACSFINSNYMGFGTGLIPKGCGFTLQNRGHNFSLKPDHPNVLSPNKRPYHTIIPAMATKENELYASFGVMGGFMQPQGHVQVLLNLVEHGMNPQEALDHPRFCIMDGTAKGAVALEEGIPIDVMSQLSNMGHVITPTTGYGRGIFGRGQIIMRDSETRVISAGSDPRADGLAIGW